MTKKLPLIKGLIFLCALLIQPSFLFAQATVTINTGVGWIDTELNSGTNATKKYASSIRFAANAWTEGSTSTIKRSLLRINNLSQIPTGATIHKATLYLYSDPTVTSSTASKLEVTNFNFFRRRCI